MYVAELNWSWGVQMSPVSCHRQGGFLPESCLDPSTTDELWMNAKRDNLSPAPPPLHHSSPCFWAVFLPFAPVHVCLSLHDFHSAWSCAASSPLHDPLSYRFIFQPLLMFSFLLTLHFLCSPVFFCLIVFPFPPVLCLSSLPPYFSFCVCVLHGVTVF